MEEPGINLPPIPQEPAGLVLLEDAQRYLHQAGKWSKFLGILGFISSAILVLIALSFSAFMSLLARYQPAGAALPAIFGGAMSALYIALAVLNFFGALYLYQFGVRIKNGINYNNPLEVSAGLGKLKSFFKLSGITAIVILVLYALIIIAVIVGAIIGLSMVGHG